MKKLNSTFKVILLATLYMGLASGLTSCNKKGCTDPTATNFDDKAKKDDGSCEFATPAPTPTPTPTPGDSTDTRPKGEVTKSGKISASETWTSNNIYKLSGKVVVESGATLTIEAGTIIKGLEGQESAASALVVARGGKVMAVGTAAKPIIFTSVLDNITYDQKVGSNLKKTDNQLWGGIVMLGYAKVSAENGDTEGNIEGINPNDGFGKYGGSNDADNSGELAYVSIRHGGISIGEGNELNALTLGGVGNGTKISNVEVYATLDDGIECFGGSVNISNALVFYQGDDGIDLDQNYSGTISEFAVIHGDGIGTDEGLEIDGPEGSTHKTGMFTVKNGICKALGTDGSPGDFKSKAQGKVENVTFEYGTDAIKIRASYTGCSASKSDAFTYLTASPATLSFTNSKFAGVKVYTASDDGATPPVTCTVPASDQTAAEGKMNGGGSGSSFDYKTAFSWSAASARGEL